MAHPSRGTARCIASPTALQVGRTDSRRGVAACCGASPGRDSARPGLASAWSGALSGSVTVVTPVVTVHIVPVGSGVPVGSTLRRVMPGSHNPVARQIQCLFQTFAFRPREMSVGGEALFHVRDVLLLIAQAMQFLAGKLAGFPPLADPFVLPRLARIHLAGEAVSGEASLMRMLYSLLMTAATIDMPWTLPCVVLVRLRHTRHCDGGESESGEEFLARVHVVRSIVLHFGPRLDP